MANEDTYRNLTKEDKEKAVRSGLMPFFAYAAIPIIITIAIAYIFGPSVG